MQKKYSKVLCLMIALILLAAVFSACGGAKDTKAESSAAGSSQAQGSAPQETTAPAKDLSLTGWYTHSTDLPRPEPEGENLVKSWLKDRTKVSIDQLYGNGGQLWTQKLTLLAASEDMPHVVLNTAFGGAVEARELSKNDLIWELTPEMLQKYCPNAWSRIPESIWMKNAVDGKIYGIPRGVDASYGKDVDKTFTDDKKALLGEMWNDLAHVNIKFYVRDDIMKKLFPEAKTYDELEKLLEEKGKLDPEDFMLPIKTTDEWIKFLYDIKALNLKEGKKTVYPVGLNGGDNWLALSMIGADMVGYKNYNYLTYWDVQKQEIGFGYLNPDVKQAASFFNKMLRDKVVEPESIIHKGDQWNAKVKQGLYGVTVNWTPVSEANDMFKKENKPYKYRPFITQVPNKTEWPFYKTPPAPYGTVNFMKTIKEEELPQVLSYFDLQYTEEFEEVYFWGPKEAGLYDEAADGKRTFKDASWEKFFNQGDQSVKIEDKDKKGIRLDSNIYGVYSSSKWDPRIVNKVQQKLAIDGYMYRLDPDNAHTKGMYFPPMNIWDGEFQGLKSVTDFWNKRAMWDDPFKIAITAKSDEEFEKKWEASVNNLKENGIDTVLKEMTDIAKPKAEEIDKVFGSK